MIRTHKYKDNEALEERNSADSDQQRGLNSAQHSLKA